MGLLVPAGQGGAGRPVLLPLTSKEPRQLSACLLVHLFVLFLVTEFSGTAVMGGGGGGGQKKLNDWKQLSHKCSYLQHTDQSAPTGWQKCCVPSEG